MKKMLPTSVLSICALGALFTVQPLFGADEGVREAVKEEVGGTLLRDAEKSMPITGDLLKQGEQGGEMTKDAAGGELLEITAKVVATNDYAQMIRLKGPTESKWYTVPDKVWRATEIKPNDVVKISYYEAVATELLTGGGGTQGYIQDKPVDKVQLKPGEKPEAQFKRGITLFGTVDSIDKANSKVTVRGRDGNLKTIRVQDPEVLNDVKVGNNIRATYVEALAVSIEQAN